MKLLPASSVAQWYINQRVFLLDNWVIPLNLSTERQNFCSRMPFFLCLWQGASYKTEMQVGAVNNGFLHFSKIVMVLAS